MQETAAEPRDGASSKTVVLWMIVKNERDVIERCLRSVLPLIDTWCIVDTGSTDGTQDVIRAVMADLPGELHERPWVNFAHNRTEAIELAAPLGDYGFTIDADELLHIDEGTDIAALKAGLDADVYALDFCWERVKFPRYGIMSFAIRWCYRSVLHEYLQELEPIRPRQFLPALSYRYAPGGARSKNPNKFRDDALTLERALASETEPLLVARYTYYLGQSWRDAGEPEKSLHWYRERAKLGGFLDEVSVSLTEAGHLCARLGRPANEVLDCYTKAWEAAPLRAEALYYAAKFCREHQRAALAFLYASAGSRIPLPEFSLLSEPDVYDWRLQFEVSVAAFYASRLAEGAAACEALLANPHVPDDVRALTVSNMAFYK